MMTSASFAASHLASDVCGAAACALTSAAEAPSGGSERTEAAAVSSVTLVGASVTLRALERPPPMRRVDGLAQRRQASSGAVSAPSASSSSGTAFSALQGRRQAAARDRRSQNGIRRGLVFTRRRRRRLLIAGRFLDLPRVGRFALAGPLRQPIGIRKIPTVSFRPTGIPWNAKSKRMVRPSTQSTRSSPH